jgi:hypothetical protein
MLDSIGSLIDRLVVENIKVAFLREKLHDKLLTDEEVVTINNKMLLLNNNRSKIVQALNEKIDKVLTGEEPNVVLKTIKTYE